MKTLSLYHGQLESLRHQREELDKDIAQVLAEGVIDGHNIYDLFYPSKIDTKQTRFDL
jgi:hypothetical protein